MKLLARARYWWHVAPLLAVLAGVYWLNHPAAPIKPAVLRDAHLADALVYGISAQAYDLQGKPHFLITAKQLTHYPDDDSSQLIHPDVTMLTPSGADLHLTGARGVLSQRGDLVELMGEVQVTRAAVALQSELVVRSDYLKFLPKLDRVSSNRAVTFSDAYNTINAHGFELDNRAQTLAFLSQVKAVHVVKQN
ncbi:MAG: LPS export ABC transporter periplasmic protein LptC [Gallionella sp.]